MSVSLHTTLLCNNAYICVRRYITSPNIKLAVTLAQFAPWYNNPSQLKFLLLKHKKPQKLKDKTFYSVNILTVTAALKYIKLLKLKVDQDVLQIMWNKTAIFPQMILISKNKLLNSKIILVTQIRQVNRKPYLTILHMQIVLIHHSKHMKIQNSDSQVNW